MRLASGVLEGYQVRGIFWNIEAVVRLPSSEVNAYVRMFASHES